MRHIAKFGLAVFAALACTFGGALPAAHADSALTTTEAAGGWTSIVNCAFTSFDPATGNFTCVGSSAWDGTWTGVTHYTASGNLNVATGDASGTVDETFTGIATADRSQGTLTFHETFTINGATNGVLIDATIVSSSGDPTFQCSSGEIVFDGIDPVVLGTGGYHGSWAHGCPTS